MLVGVLKNCFYLAGKYHRLLEPLRHTHRNTPVSGVCLCLSLSLWLTSQYHNYSWNPSLGAIGIEDRKLVLKNMDLSFQTCDPRKTVALDITVMSYRRKVELNIHYSLSSPMVNSVDKSHMKFESCPLPTLTSWASYSTPSLSLKWWRY